LAGPFEYQRGLPGSEDRADGRFIGADGAYQMTAVQRLNREEGASFQLVAQNAIITLNIKHYGHRCWKTGASSGPVPSIA